jgi:hypothetical protein
VDLDRGLAFPGYEGMLGGNAASHYKRRISHSKRGAERCAPLRFLPEPPGISNRDDEIAAG